MPTCRYVKEDEMIKKNPENVSNAQGMLLGMIWKEQESTNYEREKKKRY
jgi:hypothetical protein